LQPQKEPRPSLSHNHTTRILLLGLLVEPLGQAAQLVALGDQTVQLLAALEQILDGLVQHDLGLIQLGLHGADARQLGVDGVGAERLELRPVEGAGGLLLDLGGREARLEVVDGLGEHGLRGELVVAGLRDEDRGEAQRGAVGVDVGCLFFDHVPGAWGGALGHGFGGEEEALFVTARWWVWLDWLRGGVWRGLCGRANE